MAAAPILNWEQLSLHQGAGWLFRDLDLAIGPRDRLALIGRNGAGKTTLLRLVAGRSRPTRASARSSPAPGS
jgi:ABC transport system ATP-binding/permease protein